MLTAVVREDGTAQPERGCQVGVVRVGLALKLAELGVLTDVDLDLGIAAEAEDAGAIVSAALLEDAPDRRRLVVQRALDAGGQIRGDQQGLVAGSGLDLESGKRRRKQEHDQHPQAKR